MSVDRNFMVLGVAYSLIGRYEETIAAHKDGLQEAPDHILIHLKNEADKDLVIGAFRKAGLK